MLQRDQANTLREMLDEVGRQPIESGNTRIISITSGKGGVGKSSIAANLAVAAGKLGQRVLLLDGDFSLANLDIIFDVKAPRNICDLLQGQQDLDDVILRAAPNVDIWPASSGVFEMASLGISEKTRLLEQMQRLENIYDLIIIDTGAGISGDVTWLNSTANEVVVVATPEPTSITDAYALIKVLNQRHKMKDFKLLVNQARSESDALKVYQKITSVADRFLNVSIDYWGHVLWDEAASESIRLRKPILHAFPTCKASKNYQALATKMFKEKNESPVSGGNLKFFWRALAGNA